MRKILIFSIFALILLLSTYLTLIRNRPYNIDEFRLDQKDTIAITSILIESNLSKTKLSKSGEQWKVNENYLANQLLVKKLLRILVNIEMEILVPEPQRDSITEYLKEKSIRLIINKGENIIHELWIGPYDEKRKSTLVMNKEMIPAYVIAVGIERNISKFIRPETLLWRNKLIFDINPDSILSIELIDFRKKSNSFIINRNAGKSSIYDEYHHEVAFEKVKLERYFSYFNNIIFDSFADSLSSETNDFIINQEALYSIKITDKNGLDTNLKLYPKKLNKNSNESDLNVVYGLINSQKPLVIISYFQIDPILKDINYFKKK